MFCIASIFVLLGFHGRLVYSLWRKRTISFRRVRQSTFTLALDEVAERGLDHAIAILL